MKIKRIQGGVTAPQGFMASGVSADIKGIGTDKKDVAMIYTDTLAVCSGVYTKNKYAAAPVKWCKRVTHIGTARGVVINSGNANACTGMQGFKNAQRMAALAGLALDRRAENFFVCSTGVIGVNLPKDPLTKGVKAAAAELKADLEHGHDAALAIMTTDTFSKEIAVEFEIQGKKVTMGGMAKGSGMIHPNMATLLGFITCDAAIQREALTVALKQAADKSFNMITIDGDTSTNDSLIILCNGEAGHEPIESGSADYKLFSQALEKVCISLAKMLAKDGEGATKLLEVEVKNARNARAAMKIAKSIAGSSLVKSAFFGEDANWGRIICAVGYSGADFNPARVGLVLESAAGSEEVMAEGAGLVFNEENAAKILAEKEIRIIVDMHDGAFKAVAWGCDLTYDYVKINGSYRT